MRTLKYFLPILFIVFQTFAQTNQRDGQHDFDFEIGTWKTQLRRLERRLSGSTKWLEYEGTTDTYNGRAIVVRFVITKITDDRYRFEQSFSNDGGKTWESTGSPLIHACG